MPDIGERVAVLEAKLAALDDIQAELKAIHDEMTRYKGFLGGCTFLITCLGTFLMFGKDWLLSHWK